LRNVAAVQVDAALNDPQGEQHQQAEQDGPLRALTEAALVAGPEPAWSDLAELATTNALISATTTSAMATAPATMMAVSADWLRPRWSRGGGSLNRLRRPTRRRHAASNSWRRFLP
jgi:hypothetical protein